MCLSNYDEKLVRITTSDEGAFDGVCSYAPAEYGEAEIGRAEEMLQIDDWVFFASDIRSVELKSDDEPFVWGDRPQRFYTVVNETFRFVEAGLPTVALPRTDARAQEIRVGDVIRFEDETDETEVLRVIVQDVSPSPADDDTVTVEIELM